MHLDRTRVLLPLPSQPLPWGKARMVIIALLQRLCHSYCQDGKLEKETHFNTLTSTYLFFCWQSRGPKVLLWSLIRESCKV